jgi:hypothetical protein
MTTSPEPTVTYSVDAAAVPEPGQRGPFRRWLTRRVASWGLHAPSFEPIPE